MVTKKWLGTSVCCVGLLGLMVGCQSDEMKEVQGIQESKKETEQETSNESVEDVNAIDEREAEVADKLGAEEDDQKAIDSEVDAMEDMSMVENDAVTELEQHSFKWDIEKEYTYRISDGNGIESVFTQAYIETIENEKGSWDTWHRTYEESDSNEINDIALMENDHGLYVGFPESEYFQSMQYPVKRGDTFADVDDILTTVAVDETITVAAGTFNHVTVVKTEDSTFVYHAPEVGTILTKNVDGDVLLELLEMK